MTPEEYTAGVLETFPSEENYDQAATLNLAALGLTGEAGEFADIIKKMIFHKHPYTEATQAKLVLELGDILWYVAVAAEALGYTLSGVMGLNLVKLAKRYPAGFSPERSLNRDTAP